MALSRVICLHGLDIQNNKKYKDMKENIEASPSYVLIENCIQIQSSIGSISKISVLDFHSYLTFSSNFVNLLSNHLNETEHVSRKIR